jgi:hypothetical protein
VLPTSSRFSFRRRAAAAIRQSVTAAFAAASAGAVTLLDDQLMSALLDTGYVPIRFRNGTGVAVEAGDVLAVDYTTGAVFNGSAAEAGGIILTWVIAVEHIEAEAVGAFGVAGVMAAKFSLLDGAPVTPGTWLEKRLVAGSTTLQSVGLNLASNNQPAPPNAIAYALQDVTEEGQRAAVYFPGGPRTDLPSATWFEFFEDFLTADSIGDTVTGATICSNVWLRTGATVRPPSPPGNDGGVFAFDQNAAGDPPAIYTGSSIINPTDCMLEVRYAQKGSGAGARRVGLWGTTPDTSLPNNGILLNHSAGGVMTVVVRVAAVSTTLNTTFVQADGEFATWRIQHDSAAGAFLVYRNGVYLGHIVSDVPAVPLDPGFAASAATASAYIDFIRVRSRR